MGMDKSKIVLTFKHPRIPRSRQEAEGRAFFGLIEPQVHHVGELPKLAIEAAKATREDDIVWVYALPMIVVSRKLAEVGHHAQITLFTETIHANRATLIEGSTGRTSAKWRERKAMVEEAHKIVTRGGKRLPVTGKSAGRPRNVWPSPQIEDEWRRKWNSKNYASDAAVIREAKLAGLTERLIRSLGKSARNR
jgi:hypothetical protein